MTTVAAVGRVHIEDVEPWSRNRPGRSSGLVTVNTVAHRLGTLRMSFVRIQEWGGADVPARVPIITDDLPRQDKELPKALDDADADAARSLRAAQGRAGC